ncbi:MAG: C25 family cysteine peptidase [Candidatus Asgardarchaeia archaeon]
MNIVWIAGSAFLKNIFYYNTKGFNIFFFPTLRDFLDKFRKKPFKVDFLFFLGSLMNPTVNEWNELYSVCLKNKCGVFFKGGWVYPKELMNSKFYSVFPVTFTGKISNNLVFPKIAIDNISSYFKNTNFHNIPEIGGFVKVTKRPGTRVFLVVEEYEKPYPLLSMFEGPITTFFFSSDFFGWGKHLFHWPFLAEFLSDIVCIASKNKLVEFQNQYFAESKEDILPSYMIKNYWYLKHKEKFADKLLLFVDSVISAETQYPDYIYNAMNEFIYVAGYFYESLNLWRKAALTLFLSYYFGKLKKPEAFDLLMRGKLHYLFARMYLKKSLLRTAEHLTNAYQSYIIAHDLLTDPISKKSAKAIALFYKALSEIVRGVYYFKYDFYRGAQLFKMGVLDLIRCGSSSYGHGFAKKIYKRKEIFTIILSLEDIFLFVDRLLFRSFNVRFPLGWLLSHIVKSMIMQGFGNEYTKSITSRMFINSVKDLRVPSMFLMLKRRKTSDTFNNTAFIIFKRISSEKILATVTYKNKSISEKFEFPIKAVQEMKSGYNALFAMLSKGEDYASYFYDDIIHISINLYNQLPKIVKNFLLSSSVDGLVFLYSANVPPLHMSYITEENTFVDLKYAVSRIPLRSAYILNRIPKQQPSKNLKLLMLKPSDISLELSKFEIESIMRYFNTDVFQIKSSISPVKQFFILSDKLTAENYNIIHFIGHGNILTAAQVPLLLTSNRPDAQFIAPSFFIDLPNKPLLFFNACFSGYVGNLEYQTSNFAFASIDAGAGGFVGASYLINSKFAANFSKMFYKFLSQGEKSVAKVLKDTKTHFFRKSKNLSWLLYEYYGHPKFKLGGEKGVH